MFKTKIIVIAMSMLSRIGKSKPANEILNKANRGKLALAAAGLIIIVLIFLLTLPTVPNFADFKAGPERKAVFSSYFHPLLKQKNHAILESRKQLVE